MYINEHIISLTDGSVEDEIHGLIGNDAAREVESGGADPI